MISKAPLSKYVVISPVKDESRNVEATLRSVAAQTIRPAKWVIVDDGSSDGTVEIVRQYAKEHSWIEIVEREKRATRGPGSPVIQAFYAGFDRINPEEFGLIVKLDCDVDLPAHYFEFLIGKFDDNPTLGIASGIYQELEKSTWQEIPLPAYHAAGASKVMRTECFRQIGGFVSSRGWDTVDEIKAQVLGWRTQHFPELAFKHLKKEGSSIGAVPTNIMHGEVYYLTGGSRLFFLLKVAHRIVSEKPYVLGGLALAWGYLKSAMAGRTRLVTDPEAQFYSRQLNTRIWQRIAGILRVSELKTAWSSN